jgi:hypothetical protein
VAVAPTTEFNPHAQFSYSTFSHPSEPTQDYLSCRCIAPLLGSYAATSTVLGYLETLNSYSSLRKLVGCEIRGEVGGWNGRARHYLVSLGGRAASDV